MNVYEKLSAARAFFMNAGAKKSGYNTFAKYHYFELGDILPVINRAAAELKFCCIARFGKEEAVLDFVDSENPQDRISFFFPMAGIELKNNHAIQNAGAAQTYARRYLYLTAFEIVECDAIDAAGTGNGNGGGKAGSGAQGAQNAQGGNPPGQLALTDGGDAAARQPGGGGEHGHGMARIFDEARYPDGSLVFTEEDRAYYRVIVKDNGYKTANSILQEELKLRLNTWALEHP